ncbi:MAG: dTDP-4-dehydrorhamnose reductase [Paracoccaceae bacterium]
MCILVFGQTGQVASELQLQADVTALSRADVDLSEPDACAAIIRSEKPKIVINAAAYTAVDKAEEEEDLATLVNGDAPAAMARAAAKLGIPFLHISTDYVFDGTGKTAWKPDDPTSPLGAYGRSKLLGEIGVSAAGGNAAILRTSWVFSAHGNNFLKTMLRLGKEQDALSVVADQIGGPTPAAAIAAALLKVSNYMKNNDNLSGIYHFSGKPDVSWADFAREIFSQASLKTRVKDIPTSEFPTPAKRPGNSRMDCASLSKKFGIDRPEWRLGVTDALKQLQ